MTTLDLAPEEHQTGSQMEVLNWRQQTHLYLDLERRGEKRNELSAEMPADYVATVGAVPATRAVAISFGACYGWVGKSSCVSFIDFASFANFAGKRLAL